MFYLVAGALSALSETQEQENNVDESPLHYTEAVPSSDFTLNNISSTVEEVFAAANIASRPSFLNTEDNSAVR